MKTETEYEKQAQDFLELTGATIEVKYARTGRYFPDDTEARDIYDVTIRRGKREYTFPYGQSIYHSGKYHITNPNTHYIQNIVPGTGTVAHKITFGLVRGTDYMPNDNFSAPSAYDILAAVTKHDPGTFEDFCDECGYDQDSRSAEKVYGAVRNEYLQLSRLFTDTELSVMEDIS